MKRVESEAPSRHHEIVALYKEHGISGVGLPQREVYRHVFDLCDCPYPAQNGRTLGPLCCKARCGMTLAEHEAEPPRFNTYHAFIWRWQRRMLRLP